MKNLAILTVLASVLVFTNGAASGEKATSSSSAEENIRELAKTLNEKFNTTLLLDIIKMAEKAKETCPEIETKIEGAMDKVGECLEDIDLGSDTFCSLVKKNFVKCSKPAKDLIVSCMPEESKGIPVMMEKMFMAIIETACSSTVEEMLELLNPCKFEKDISEFAACKEVKATIDSHRNELPSKTLVCQTLPKMRNCAKEASEASCHNAITKEAHLKMHDAISKAVKDECDSINKV